MNSDSISSHRLSDSAPLCDDLVRELKSDFSVRNVLCLYSSSINIHIQSPFPHNVNPTSCFHNTQDSSYTNLQRNPHHQPSHTHIPNHQPTTNNNKMCRVTPQRTRKTSRATRRSSRAKRDLTHPSPSPPKPNPQRKTASKTTCEPISPPPQPHPHVNSPAPLPRNPVSMAKWPSA